ncbi:MAG: DNA mismatch repair protein MutS [Bacteroidales bacterium]|jgi:DNA mismatch repair protein MutS|nr:DNA mismatch repair protein MutS [Bacteroidales bacterium]
MAEPKKHVETPLMRQYYEVKSKYPDALLLFHVGDFYETFGDDAVEASKILGITLTKRANGAAQYVELAGFPHHAVDTYLPKLVKAGKRVAICEQLENPKFAKGIVKRGVTELVTPGVSYNEKTLELNQNNFLAGVHLNEQNSGIAFLDISTGEFYVAQGGIEYIDKMLQSFKPSEVIVQRNKRKDFEAYFGDKFYINTFDDWVFQFDFAHETLLKQFNVKSLKGFGVDDMTNGLIAAGSALHYLAETQHNLTSHICKIARIVEDHYVWLDKFTIRNLELVQSANERATTLLDVLNQTVSPMGARLLKRWIVLPLRDQQPIEERLNVVEFFIKKSDLADELRAIIKRIGDLERLISKVAIGKIMPREMVKIKDSLYDIEDLIKLCSTHQANELEPIIEHFDLCKTIRKKIKETLNDEAPIAVNKGNVIRKGIHAELDELREMAYSGKDFLIKLQQREIENTGITNLKVAFNNVFGYYLEVSKANQHKVPSSWTRKQTLTNGERYITEELKVYEQKILTAEERILELESQLFRDLVIAVGEHIKPIQYNAQLLARLDCLLSFAQISKTNHYNRPVLSDGYALNITGGRHPVIETQLPIGEDYISNDVFLDNTSQQIMIITGPNMSGKSALLRQTALIVLMAQMGCFVPADAAEVGLVDRVFTRVGASDNISSGESTFMVEMNETASILNNISNRSLILLDEIGRGTSTYDGISIAWAIAEYLHEHPKYKAKVLFATHYHELNDMAEQLERIKNFHVSVKEVGNNVIFLRKLKPGGSEHSFGIHVARMAGMPQRVLTRAEEQLKWLESSREISTAGAEKVLPLQSKTQTNSALQADYQLSFIQLDDPLLEEIKMDILNTNIDTLTPVEALMKLNAIKGLLQHKS